MVYRAERELGGETTESAIKVIRIPSNPTEGRALIQELGGEEAARQYFKDVVDGYSKEILAMDILKGITNIVCIEDYAVEENPEALGWTIYIRMEFLTPFPDYAQTHTMDEAEVIRLGIDLCTALKYCEKAGIIHRDIKPSNIFVSAMGNFKLGDFGVSRKLEAASGKTASTGTFPYMAPEVYNGQDYDHRADQYSLGLVLYRLMNHGREPFVNPDKQLVTLKDKQSALMLRVSGKEVPPPCSASPGLTRVILKALQYLPAERYRTAEEFGAALESIGKEPAAAPDAPERPAPQASAARPAAQASPAPVPPPAAEQTPPPKKKRRFFTGVLPALLAVAVAVGGGLYLLKYPGALGGNAAATPSPTAMVTAEPTATPTPAPTAIPADAILSGEETFEALTFSVNQMAKGPVVIKWKNSGETHYSFGWPVPVFVVETENNSYRVALPIKDSEARFLAGQSGTLITDMTVEEMDGAITAIVIKDVVGYDAAGRYSGTQEDVKIPILYEVKDEALEAAKLYAKKILDYLQTDNKSAFLKLYNNFGEEYKEELSQSFSDLKSKFDGYDKVFVSLYAKYKDIFGYDFVFYRVSGKYPNTKNSSDYTIRKINGQWQLYYPNAEELKELDADAMRRLPQGLQEAAEAGRNYATFGNRMWLDPSLVFEGIAVSEMMYMYQNQDKSVDLAVALRNGTDEIRTYKSIQIKITDDKLGTVISQKRNVNISVNPGQTYFYELHLKSNQLKKEGKWTNLHSSIETTTK